MKSGTARVNTEQLWAAQKTLPPTTNYEQADLEELEAAYLNYSDILTAVFQEILFSTT